MFHLLRNLSQTFTNVTKQIQTFHFFSDLSQTFHFFSDLIQTFKTLRNQSKRLKRYETKENVFNLLRI